MICDVFYVSSLQIYGSDLQAKTPSSTSSVKTMSLFSLARLVQARQPVSLEFLLVLLEVVPESFTHYCGIPQRFPSIYSRLDLLALA